MQTWSKRHYHSVMGKKKHTKDEIIWVLLHTGYWQSQIWTLFRAHCIAPSSYLLFTMPMLREICLFHLCLQFFLPLLNLWFSSRKCLFYLLIHFEFFFHGCSCLRTTSSLSLPPGVEHSKPALLRQSTASTKPGMEEASSLFPVYAKTSPICPRCL